MDIIWDRHLHALIPRNPIIVHVLRHQQRTTTFLKGFLESVGVVAVALCFLVAMIFSVVYRLNPWRWGEYIEPIQLLAWIFHCAAVLRLLAAGVAITKWDGDFLSSDALRSTPLSNWQLLIGKWWGAMHSVRGWMLALGIMQLGIVLSTAFGLVMTIDWGMECLTPCVLTINGLVQPSGFTILGLLFIVTSAIGISILETSCCTALGIAVATLLPGGFCFIGALPLRFAPVLIFSFFPDYPRANGELMWRYSEYTWFSFADGGTGAIVQLVQPVGIWGIHLEMQRGILALCAVVGMFLLYIGLSLVTTWAVMERSRP